MDWETPITVLSGWVGCAIGFAFKGGFHRSTPEAVSSQQDTARERNFKRTALIGGVVLITVPIGLAIFIPRGPVWLWLLMGSAIGVIWL